MFHSSMVILSLCFVFSLVIIVVVVVVVVVVVDVPGDTLLQQKLQESNSRLCADVGQTLRQVYGNACREVRL